MAFRTPTIVQMQPPDNGVIALSIVMAHLGRFEPTWLIRQSAGTDASGNTMTEIAEGARAFGLVGTTTEATPEDLKNEAGPVIVGWANGSFVVVEGHDRSGWALNDPAVGRRWVSGEEFAENFDGRSLRIERGPDFQPGGAPRSGLRSLRRAIEGCSSAIISGIVASTALVPVGLAQAGLITYFIDVLLVVRRPELIPPFLLVAVVIFTVLAMLFFLLSQSQTRMSVAIGVRLKSRLLNHTVRLPQPERSLRAPGDVQQRLAITRQTANSLIPPLVLIPANLLAILVFGAAVVLISFPVAIGLVGSICIGFLIARVIHRRIFSLSARSQVLIGLQQSVVYTGLSSRAWLLESGGLRRLLESWLGISAEGRNLAQERGGIQVVAKSGRNLVNQLVAQVATLVIGGLQVMNGSMTLGELAALQFLVVRLATSVAAVLAVVQTYPILNANLARIDDILDVPVPDEAAVDRSEEGRDQVMAGVAVDDDRMLQGAVPAGSLLVIRDLDRRAIDRVAAGIASSWRSKVGNVRITTGRLDLFPGTLVENLTGFEPRIGNSKVREIIEFTGLEAKTERPQGGIAANVREDLPFGDDDEESRLEMASVLLDPPTLMIARSGLGRLPAADVVGMLDRLRSGGTAVIVLDPEVDGLEDAVVIKPRRRGEVPA